MRLIDADAIIRFIDMGHLRSPYEKSFSESEVVDMLESAPTVAIWHTKEPTEYENYIVWVETEKYTGLEMDYYASYGWDDWQGGVVAWLEIPSPLMIGGNK